jgi:ribosomal protein L37AE/L43A
MICPNCNKQAGSYPTSKGWMCFNCKKTFPYKNKKEDKK